MIDHDTLGLIIPIIGFAVVGSLGGWIFTTWLRVKHGYPLEGKWGQSVHPGIAAEAHERIKLLATENAQLRAELGSVKDRLGNVERIVTDRGARLSAEIDQLRSPKLN